MIDWILKKFQPKTCILRYEWNEEEMMKVFYNHRRTMFQHGDHYPWASKTRGYKRVIVNFKNEGQPAFNTVEYEFETEEDAAIWKLTYL